MKHLLLLLLVTHALFSLDEEVSPPPIAEVDEQLESAEELFQKAKNMFNPWYSGPLLTGSSSMMDPGEANIQAYIFATSNYAFYNRRRDSIDVSTLWVVNPTLIVQWGVVSFLDMNVSMQGLYQTRNGKHSGGFGDLSYTLGIKLLGQTPYLPGIKLELSETFPTGRYERASSSGLDLTGDGAYTTSLSLNISKVIWWFIDHPMNLRLSTSYNVYRSDVGVNGINSFGGASNTNGTVSPGRAFQINFGAEYSLTQRWVLACDLAYEQVNRASFKGFSGTLASGAPATNTLPSRDSLSIAPALEYNFSPKLGIIAGGWFTLYGRNTFNFASAVASVQWTFP